MFRSPRPARERLRFDGVGAFFLRVVDAVLPSVTSLGPHGGRPTLGTGGLVRQMIVSDLYAHASQTSQTLNLTSPFLRQQGARGIAPKTSTRARGSR